MPLFLLLLSLAHGVTAQRGAPEPFISISVWYPASGNIEALQRDFALIRRPGFKAVTTSIAWRAGEPRRGEYNLLPLDRVIAVATAASLRVHVEVDLDAAPE